VAPADFWGIRKYEDPERNRLWILNALRHEVGFRVVRTSLVEEARASLGVRYELHSRLDEDLPASFDCSSFTAHVYGRIGIRIPRITIDQLNEGPGTILDAPPFLAGDLIFTGDRFGYHDGDPDFRIRHVAISTGDGSIIHASKTLEGVVEGDERRLFERRTFRAARRILPTNRTLLTLESLDGREVRDSNTVLRGLQELIHPFIA
jgi:hypothetical protein